MGVVLVCSVLPVLALLLAWWASGFRPVLVDTFSLSSKIPPPKKKTKKLEMVSGDGEMVW